MAHTVQRKRVVGNPGKRAVNRKRSNPGEILGFTLANPGRKVAHKKVAHTTKKSKKKNRATGHKSTKRNPGTMGGHKTHRRATRKNVGGGAMNVGGQVTNAVFAIVGALGSKLGAQVILGEKNTGLVGYAANLGVGGALWLGAEKVLKNRNAASGILTGTLIQVLLRAINDYTPFGSYVAQLGMGDYQMQSFVTPQVLVSPNESAQIRIPGGWAPTTVLAPPAAPPMSQSGMSGLYSNPGSFGNIYG